MTTDSNEYVFRLKKGDMEIEIRSNDSAFMQVQMENWRHTILSVPAPMAMQSAPAMPAMAGAMA